MEKFIIVKDFVKKVKRFNLQGRTLEFKIKSIPRNEEPVSWVRNAINQVIEKATEDIQLTDQVGFTFCDKDFKRGDGWIRFRPAEEISYHDIWDVISGVYQSNSGGVFNTKTFCLGVTTVRMPTGNGRGSRYNNFDEECGKRRGIVVINNKDNMCLPRALVVAIAHAKKDPDESKVRRDVGKLQSQRALQLCADSGVVIPGEGSGIPELNQFQRHLQNFKIVVYKYGTNGRDIIFKGPHEGPSLNLLHHNGHYNVINSLTAAFCCNYYCEECHIPYRVKNKHRCGGTCQCCQKSPACLQTLKIKCDVCKRSFRGQDCYDNHRKPGSLGKSTVCSQIKLCNDCLKTVQTGRQHTCGEIYCKICSAHVPSDHMCYMSPDTGKPKTNDILFIFYDLETRQEKVLKNGDHQHEPNLCVLAKRCDACISENKLYLCQKCGYRVIVYRDSVISDFMKHLLEIRKKFKHIVVIAHNGQAFDHHFILNYILTTTDLKPNLIMRGTKIVMMELENVKFLDSLNYFPMALSKLPKAFDLQELKKGYFPHLFNTEENKNYVDLLPDVEYYSPDTMREDERKKFLLWYAEHKEDQFDIQHELVEYCVSDVNILTQACLKFREQMLSTSNVCPFTEACTIASCCNKVFRRNFLQANTIGIIPKGGYRWKDNQSKIVIEWLIWEEKQRHINIIHAAKQREAVVHGVKVDGFCSETNQVFEFHGCYFHGCPVCFKFNRSDPLDDNPRETLNLRHECTIAKRERLRDLGYEVIEMWECQFRRLSKSCLEIEEYTKNHPLLTVMPLNPRDAFYGGRTGNTRTYYKCQLEQKVMYVDVCSLYPWVCKYGKFPIGHPKIYVGKECDQLILEETNGLIKCKILPPTNLYHPVLPTKMNNKLMFLLCRRCGEQTNQNDCTHNAEERALHGTWVIDEVMKAVTMGYMIIQIHEVWSYEIDQFDRTNKMGGPFRSMMDTFIKIKQQASGWPKNCHNKNEQDKYIERFLERENIKLEYAEILNNPGLRSLAKLILNSFWGKFGQRENQPKTKIIRDPCELFAMYSNPGIYVNAVLPIDENAVVVNWTCREEAYNPLSTVNVVIAAYVTAQARLKLYSYLEKLGDKVLYFDTDSVIYVSSPGEFDIPTGEAVGDMTDELEGYGPGSYITEFVSGGPKNYAYKVFSTDDNEEKVVCKVKGISLNYAASRLINFQSIKDMVIKSSDPVYIVSKNICRTKEHEIVTRTETKIYKPNSTKRKFFKDHSSVPHGYKKFKT